MSFLDGVYVIRTELGGPALSLSIGFERPIFVAVFGRASSFGQRTWRVAPAGQPGSNLYTIVQANGSNNLVEMDNRLWATTARAPAQFTITRSGPDSWTVQIPNGDKVWTLDEPDTQVRFGPRVGSPGQIWHFEKAEE